MKTFDEFRAEIRRLKAERWADILNAEPPGRPAGRRPRDPEKEKLLAELDQLRVARSELLLRAKREPVEPSDPRQRDAQRRRSGRQARERSSTRSR